MAASSSRHVFGSGATIVRRESHFAQGGDGLGAARHKWCTRAARRRTPIPESGQPAARFNCRVPTPVSSTTISNSLAKSGGELETASLSASGISRIEGATNGSPPWRRIELRYF